MADHENPRQLLELVTNEVSLVDRAANEREFLRMRKRKGDPMTDEEKRAEELRKAEEAKAAEFTNLIKSAQEAVGKVNAALAKRTDEIVKALKAQEEAPELFKSTEEVSQMIGLGEEASLLLKQGPYPLPQGFDSRKLFQALTSALAVEGLPEGAKKLIEQALNMIKTKAAAQKTEETKAGDADLRQEFESFRDAATEAIGSLNERVPAASTDGK